MPIIKLKSGTYEVRVNSTIVPGRYKTITKRARTRKEAREIEAQLIGSKDTSADITFKALSDAFLEDRRVTKAISTYLVSKTIIAKHIQPFFGKRIKAKDITPLLVRQWQNEMRKQHFSATYLHAMHEKMSAILNFGIQYYGLTKNPAREAGAMGKRGRDDKNSFWTIKEFQKFAAAIDKNPPRGVAYYVAFQTLFFTGIREGELLALFPTDIDTDAGTMRINKTYYTVPGKHILHEPKTPSSNRVITLPAFLVKMLEEYIRQLPNKRQRIFSNITKSSLNRKLKSTARKAGVKIIRVHDVRHSSVAMMLEMGIPIQEISQRLGHSSPDITYRIYSHLYPGKDDGIAEKLQAVHDEISEKGEDSFGKDK